jgi:hypothetical protein
MLFGKWRGMPVALALATTLGLGLGLTSLARADGLLFQHTIPREVDAYDFTTGGPFKAPPVPYGHYAKDYVADAQKAAGCITCRLHGLFGGPGAGHGLLHKGGHDGDGFGHGDGAVVDDGTDSGHGAGHGLFGHHATLPYDGYGSSESAGFATTWAEASGQGVVQPSGQSICGQSGCKVASKHSHLCGDPGCGKGPGHGHGLGHGGGTGCGLCGGRGCSSCLSGLRSGLQSKLASLTGAFHRPKISWFLGAGGPVPITPGYVPYIVTTRSPRDFFSFPPMNPNDP